MKYVWAIEEVTDHECSSIVSVHRTKAGAEAKKNRLEEQNRVHERRLRKSIALVSTE